MIFIKSNAKYIININYNKLKTKIRECKINCEAESYALNLHILFYTLICYFLLI